MTQAASKWRGGRPGRGPHHVARLPGWRSGPGESSEETRTVAYFLTVTVDKGRTAVTVAVVTGTDGTTETEREERSDMLHESYNCCAAKRWPTMNRCDHIKCKYSGAAPVARRGAFGEVLVRDPAGARIDSLGSRALEQRARGRAAGTETTAAGAPPGPQLHWQPRAPRPDEGGRDADGVARLPGRRQGRPRRRERQRPSRPGVAAQRHGIGPLPRRGRRRGRAHRLAAPRGLAAELHALVRLRQRRQRRWLAVRAAQRRALQPHGTAEVMCRTGPGRPEPPGALVFRLRTSLRTYDGYPVPPRR